MKSIYYILSENTPQQDTEKTEMVVSKKSDLSTKSTTSKSVDDEKEDKCLQQFKENDQALMSCPIGYEECSQKATEMSKNGASHEVVASERTKCINLQKESQFRCFDKKSKNSGYTSCLKTQVSCNADCLNDFFLDKQNSKFCMAACLDEVKACNKEIYDECKNSNS